jgi:predicted membrane protein
VQLDDERWEQRRRQWRHAPASRLFIAILLIAAGTLLFLSNLGLIPEFNIWSFWPAIFIVGGVGKLISDSTRSGQAIGIVLIAGGSLFLLISLGILHIRAHDDSWPLSLLLIAFGAIALIKVLDLGETGRPRIGFPDPSIGTGNVLREQVIFGSLKRKVESTSFQGGKLESVFGSIELDLRRAQISAADRSATLEVNAVFGSIELSVPETWRVITHAAGVFGSIEDKTIANKTSGFEGPTLLLTGAAVFGSVEIKD